MTPPTPARDTSAGRAYNDLRNLARRAGREPSEYFTWYALEGFLDRLASSEHADDFALKGGVLMAMFGARRPTRDIDLAALGSATDVPEIVTRVRAILGADVDDGLDFDTGSVKGGAIRDGGGDVFAGVRVRMSARLATARLSVHVDVNVGDPVWPAPIEVELGRLRNGVLRLPGYPDHMILAEKLVTAIDRGEQNTRWRDFVDIVAIARARQIRATDLRTAIHVVAAHRGVVVEPLGRLLESMSVRAQPKWATWRRKQRLEASTPERFVDLLSVCVALTDPALASEDRMMTWEPGTQSWTILD